MISFKNLLIGFFVYLIILFVNCIFVFFYSLFSLLVGIVKYKILFEFRVVDNKF